MVPQPTASGTLRPGSIALDNARQDQDHREQHDGRKPSQELQAFAVQLHRLSLLIYCQSYSSGPKSNGVEEAWRPKSDFEALGSAKTALAADSNR
jgi:hypothetical protein